MAIASEGCASGERALREIRTLSDRAECVYSPAMKMVFNPINARRMAAVLVVTSLTSALGQAPPLGSRPGIKPAFGARTAPEEPATATLDEIKAAAEKGLPRAQFQLGLKYLYGEGVKDDIKTASIWVTKAANGGHSEAQYFLGMVNEADDARTASEWYAKAGEQGHVKAAAKLGEMYSEGKMGKADYVR